MSEITTFDRLHALRTRFGPRWRTQKFRLLNSTSRLQLSNARELRKYHETLLFLRAYPDDRQILRAVESELKRVAREVRKLRDSGSRQRSRGLQDSGIANTINTCSLSFEAAIWLAERFPRDVGILWEEESAGETLDELLHLLVERVEEDGLLDRGFSTQAWMEIAKGRSAVSDLAWLLQRIENRASPTLLAERLFDSLHLHIRWHLRAREASRTFVRFPRRSVHYQSNGLHRHVTLEGLLALPLSKVQPCSKADAEALIDIARTTLAVRHRETDPITYANPREVTLFRLEDGVDVAIFGMLPDRRLPIESFFGYIVARNRVPIGYGGGWVFFHRCEIGVNIFDTFRGGESALMFAQVLRVYRQHYGVTRFVIDPFQFGAENTEAIRSGAFWFYYRLGFRPRDPRLCEQAQTEWRRLHRDRSYRTPSATLRRLTRSPLELDLGSANSNQTPELKDLGLAVTQWISKKFDGQREAARDWACAHVRRRLSVRGESKWSTHERLAFDRLCLLAAMLPELQSWRPTEKRALVAALRAKGGPRERKYALLLQRHMQFREGLLSIASQVKR